MHLNQLQRLIVGRSKRWFPQVWSKENNDQLVYSTIAIGGEVGEFQNKIKKYIRNGDQIYLDGAAEELADVLAYLLVLSEVLGIDITQQVLDKMKLNEQRFDSADS